MAGGGKEGDGGKEGVRKEIKDNEKSRATPDTSVSMLDVKLFPLLIFVSVIFYGIIHLFLSNLLIHFQK